MPEFDGLTWTCIIGLAAVMLFLLYKYLERDDDFPDGMA